MDDKGKRVETLTGEISLPEAIIELIQSFLTKKEAVRSTLLSKSWYNTWLTRPAIDFDYRDFCKESTNTFEEFVTKTMQRYQNSGLKIDVELVLIHSLPSALILKSVLGSETLVRSSISSCRFDQNYAVSCASLKSLTLKNVRIKSDCHVFKDLISCCISLEELSLSNCIGLHINMIELHKLRRLFLFEIYVDSMVFTDFGSRFPGLEDPSILLCYGCKDTEIASASLKTISYNPLNEARSKVEFDVPNIRKFTYSGSYVPYHLSINGASREWELDIPFACYGVCSTSCFRHVTEHLTKFRLSRISLFVNLMPDSYSQHDVDVDVVNRR